MVLIKNNIIEQPVRIAKERIMSECVDCDNDCVDITDKLWCWQYDPTTGYCPYLIKKN